MPACDLKLTGAQVVDGSGSAKTTADVGITGDRITHVGDLDSLEAASTLDCTGKTIAPGFIDIHSHSDWLVPGVDHGEVIEPFVRQGMTTLVGGNCGFSPAPISPRNKHAAEEASRLIVDDTIDLRWESMSEFLAALDTGGVSLNVAMLVGHGSVRAAVSGSLNPAEPSEEELAAMEELVGEALDAGCVGVSSGLGYPPGIFAREKELSAFASWAARHDKIFTSHLKAYSVSSGVYKSDPDVTPHNLEAIDEILRVGKNSGARLQISHLIFVGRNTWPTHGDAIAKIETARSDGLDVAFDAFPYTAGNTTASVLFPAELLPHLEQTLQDPDAMGALRAFGDLAFSKIGFDLEDIQIMNANTPAFDEYNGMFVGDAARRAGMDVWDFYARMVLDSKRQARVLIHKYSGDADDEEALRAILGHKLCTIETDTFVTRRGHQNPASYGTFPRVLSTYVDEGLFSFEEAVHKMTGAAAQRLGWDDRGYVREGCAADLVVLETSTLKDRASFEEPTATPDGIEHVFINGRHVLDGDRYDPQARAGKLLRA